MFFFGFCIGKLPNGIPYWRVIRRILPQYALIRENTALNAGILNSTSAPVTPNLDCAKLTVFMLTELDAAYS